MVTLLVCGLPYRLGVGWVGAPAVPGEVLNPFSLSTTAGRAVGWVVNHAGHHKLWAPALTTARTRGMAAAVLVGVVCALRARSGDRPAALRSDAVTTSPSSVGMRSSVDPGMIRSRRAPASTYPHASWSIATFIPPDVGPTELASCAIRRSTGPT